MHPPIYRFFSTLAVLATLALAPFAASAQPTCSNEVGPTYILDTVDMCANIHDGAQLRQGVPVNAGTGNLDPFLRVSKGGNGVTVHGINGDGTHKYDEGSSWTSALLLSAISLYFDPATDTIYREFVLDINQSSNPGVYYPINDLRLYKGASGTLNNTFNAPGISPADYPGLTKIWDLDNGTDPDQRAILLDYDFEAGSGNNPDMILRIPDAEFAGPDYCSYGQSGCTTYVYLYTRHGEVSEVTVPPTGGTMPPLERDNAGFEEWATFVKPFAEVDKTAFAQVGEEYDWTIDKTADPDQCSAFAGGECDVDYHLTVTKTPYNVEITVSGTITIHVPTIFPVTGATIKTPLVVTEVTDLFGGVEYDNGYIDCPLAEPFTLAPGATTVCDYEFTLTEEQYATLLFDGPHGFPTNMPTNVALAIGVEVGTGGELIYTPFPSDATDVSENGYYAAAGAILSVDVFDTPEGQSTDDLGDAAHSLVGQIEQYVDGVDFTDAVGTFECSTNANDYVDAGTHYAYDRTNLGEIEDNGTVLDDDDAVVTIDCFLPQIAKTANGSYDNLWEWEIDKVVVPEVADLFAGQSINPDYTITLTKSGPVQANHLVSGVISITNPSTDLDLDLDVSLVDQLSDLTSAVLGAPCESGEVTVLAGQTVDCPYTAEPSDDSAVSNTATATTLDGFDFSDTVGFDWLVTEVNGTVNVSDTNKDGGMEFGASGTWEYSDLEFSCPTAEEEYVDGEWSDSYDNTASIDEIAEATDDATFALNCYAPIVDKDANTELDRTYSWSVAKSIADATEGNVRYGVTGDADALAYAVIAGDAINSDFTIVVSRDSTDSNWKVSGTISVENPAGTPPGAMDITVSDVITLDGEDDITGVVTCADAVGDPNHVIVGAGDTVECTYAASLPDDQNRTNTATATLHIGIGDGVPFTVVVPVNFYVDDELVAKVNRFNETASLSDAVVVDGGDPAANGSWEFDWSTPLEALTIEYDDPFSCSTDQADFTDGMYSVSRVNTATLVDKDEDEFSDDASRDATCYAPDVDKDANEWIVRTYEWDVAKTVADKDASVANADPNVLVYDVFVNDSDVAAYTITITRDSTDTWFVSGTIDLMNPAGSPADMDVDVSDLIPGQMSMFVSCEGAIDPEAPADGNTSITLAPGVGQQCFYFAQLPDTDQRLNTATALFEGNPFQGTADVIFDEDTPIQRENESIDVDDFSSVDDGGEASNADGGPWSFDWTTKEIDLVVGYDVEFACSANPADYIDGMYTSTRANRAVIRGTDIEDDADVTLNCYAPVVDKDATTSYDRQWNWTIMKSAEDQESEQAGADNQLDANLESMWINLQGSNQAFLVTYTLVIHAESEESNEAVTGTITVDNPHPSAVMTVDVADLLPDATNMSVVCEGAGTTVLDVAPLGTGTCTYSADLPSATVQRLNTGRVTLNDVDFDATADVIFGVPTNEYDRCVDVEDLAGPLGLEVLNVVATEICATGPETGPLGDGETFDPDAFTYDVQFGGSDPGGDTAWVPLEDCLPYEHPNTASLRGDDDVVVADDQWWIYFNVGCPGCTLTQGYWKTHSELFWGGAPEDATWNILFTDGEDGCDPNHPETCAYDGDRDFFNGEYSWFDVMVTPPRGGNPFYQLGHQWIAATLNTLAGAFTPPEVEEALTVGGSLLEKYSADPDALVIKGKGKKNPASEEIVEDAAMMGTYASLLASYNEGDIGPGHCDDDGTEQFGVSNLVNVAGSVDAAVELDGTSTLSEAGSEVKATTDKADQVDITATSDVQAAEAPATGAVEEASSEEGARVRPEAEGKGDDEIARLKAGDDKEIIETGSQSEVGSPAARIEIPSEFAVGNYPNPFNPTTTIQVALPEASHVRVAVYDLLGRMVTLLVDGQLSAGTHSVTFDAGQLPSGVYLYRFEYSGGAVTRTMQLLK